MDERQLRRQRRTVLVFLYVLFALFGACDGATSNLPPAQFPPDFAMRLNLLLSIPLCLGFMWFCTLDAKLAGKPLIQLARLGIFFGWPIGVPIYLVWARGLKGLGLLLLHGFLLLSISVCTQLSVAYLCYGTLWSP